MPSLSNPVCKAEKKTKNISNVINQSINKVYSTNKKRVNKVKFKIENETKKTIRELKNKKKELNKKYNNMRWRRQRPDITLLVEIMMLFLFLVILFKVLPLMTSSDKPTYSKSQFESALNLSKSDFSIAELARINLETKALKDYSQFFDSNPYSSEFSGYWELQRTNTMIPIMTFMIMYVVPPTVIAYINWFIFKYFKYVIRGTWGFIMMLKRYFTKKIEGSLGCKWYIKMVTGWRCRRNIPFSRYFIPWKVKYVDRPVWQERLRYLQKYYWAKRVYYEIPYRKYIVLPIKRLKIKFAFAKKLYIQRAYEVFLQKLLGTHDPYYVHPKEELYTRILNNNKNLAAAYAKLMQTKAKIEGKEYVSVTPSGKSCKCPADETPVRALKNTVKKISRKSLAVKDELDRMIQETNKIYDKVNRVDVKDCKTYDDMIENRKPIAKWLLVSIIAVVFLMFGFSTLFGTPKWLDELLRPTTVYVSNGLRLINSGQNKVVWVYIYLGIICSTILAIWLV